MVKIEAVSATSTPLWLLISAIAFLGLRFGLSAFESIYPPKALLEIHWRNPENISPETIKKTGSQDGKLIFYDFRADWCEPCKLMERSAFLSRDVINLLNSEFVAVKINDRKKEDGKNDSQTQELEDKFNVQAFPTLVVAMPDGSKVIDHVGSANSAALRSFLKEALTVADYYWGKEQIISGDYASAAGSFENFISKTRWQHWRCSFAAVFASTAFRKIGDGEKADKILNESLTRIHDHGFPYPVIEYLAGKRNFDSLLKEASENKNNRILSYAYAGMDCFARHDYDEAEKHFDWVLKNCDDKDTFEHRIAESQLVKIREKEN